MAKDDIGILKQVIKAILNKERYGQLSPDEIRDLENSLDYLNGN